MRLLENGDFEAEYYDYSADKDSPFPHDFAIRNVVKAADLPRMKTLLAADSRLSDDGFLAAICQKFARRDEIEDWCKANAIPCEHIY